MSNWTKSVCLLCSAAIAVCFFAAGAAAQSYVTRRITLQEAKALNAVNGSPVTNLPRLTVDVARYHRRATAADYFPKIETTFTNLHFNKFLGQTFQLARRNASLPILAKDQTISVTTVTQPITPLFKVREAVDIARADETIAQAKANQMRNLSAGNVEHTFFELLVAQRQYALAEQKANRLESGLQLTAASAVPLDGMAERRAAFLAAGKEQIALDGKVADLTERLNAMIGFAPGTELDLIVPDPQIEEISQQDAVSQAQANSADLVEAEQTVAKAEAARRLSKLDYVPEVAVTGGYVYQTAIPALPLDFSYIGVVATWTIFDFGKRENTAKERSSQLALARANVDMVKAKVAASAQKAFFDLQRTRKMRDLTRRMLATYMPAAFTAEPDSERAQAEVDMLQAELAYRDAYSEMMRVMEGR